MYTLEEIEEESKSKGWKAFWVWLLVFGIPMAILTYIISNDRIAPASLMAVLSFGDFGVLFGALAMRWVASSNTKKKMMEENAEEEHRNRDAHYQRMEELLEKMTKEKENA